MCASAKDLAEKHRSGHLQWRGVASSQGMTLCFVVQKLEFICQVTFYKADNHLLDPPIDISYTRTYVLLETVARTQDFCTTTASLLVGPIAYDALSVRKVAGVP